MTHIAITGASGFVGSHVLDALLDHATQDLRVTALIQNTSVLHRKDARLQTVVCDMHQPGEDLYENLGRPDILIHLAWAGLPHYDQSYHFERELPLQYAFLKGLVLAGLPKLLVTGTCFEYGWINGPLSVSTPCAAPTNAYAYAKRCLHQQLSFLQGTKPFVLNWARLFYIYGDRQRHGSLYSSLKKAAESGQSSFSMSSGEQLRDYLSVNEVAFELVKFAMDSQGSGLRNICSGRPISVRRIAEKWCDQYDWSVQLKFNDKQLPAYEPLAFWGMK